ncbi:hypothetical protein BCON_0686g00010 [Botryotinia convoluta]|uniref:Methyltransferase domain-containing protein n=1 Tax=Botryotinia convoluta TaxID=54673 RepID=A0A4Z1H5D8_9HELO|nr:hypothetical protein BCON_0686g00010 [Botryotinia convoluta]
MAQNYKVINDAVLAVDENNVTDGDSAYNYFRNGAESYQMSFTSSILNYKMVADIMPSVKPNDREKQVMDLLHHVYNLVLDGELHLAPISKQPQRVLDLGTGTGIWAMNFADQYPSAQVIGNDVSFIQSGWAPTNCQFEVDDFEVEWRYSKLFDYIHGREIAGAIQDFDKLVQQAFNHLTPGGFLEFQSLSIELYADDDSLKKAPFMVQLTHDVQEASIRYGKRLGNMSECPEKMINAGFTDVTCKVVKVPTTPWPKDPKQKEIGKYMPQASMSYSYALLSKVMGWNRDDIEVLLAHVSEELKDLTIHTYLKLYLVYGKKPKIYN